MGYVLRCFGRSQHAICKSEDGITIALVQDLKRRRLTLCCVFQQLLVCLLIPQSKRSILQDYLASYCCITPKGHEVTEKFCRGTDFRAKLLYRLA
jgi:hypothetical protein